MSDPTAETGEAPRWVPSPLLLGTRSTPRFLRAAWDAEQAQAFGPWRVGEPADPAITPDEPPPSVAPAPEPESTPAPAKAEPAPRAADAGPSITPEQLQEAQAQAHARGLAEGAAQARAEWEAERAREAELLRHLAIELRALNEDPDRFFEPLRRLALHIAEQLVRGELKASGHAVSQVVRQCLAALDAPADRVVASLHPDDVTLLQSLPSGVPEGLRLQPDPQLHRGSVRLRVDDTVMEDLIEHRLQALVERLMVQGGTSRGDSVLLRETSRDEAPSPARRARGAGEIIDATAVPVRDEPPGTSGPGTPG